MKKNQFFGLIIAVFILLLTPNNTSAKEANVICKYQYQNKELIYTINNKVEVPFEDGENNWYHGQDFQENYLKTTFPHHLKNNSHHLK